MLVFICLSNLYCFLKKSDENRESWLMKWSHSVFSQDVRVRPKLHTKILWTAVVHLSDVHHRTEMMGLCWGVEVEIVASQHIYLSMTSSTSILKIGLWYWTTQYIIALLSPPVKFSTNLEIEWSSAPDSKYCHEDIISPFICNVSNVERVESRCCYSLALQ